MFMYPRYYDPESYEHENFMDEQKNMASSSTGNSQFLGAHNVISVLLANNLHQPKLAGKSMDPRLLKMLEYVGELYAQRGDLLRKSFSGIHDECVDFFNKFGQVLSQVKSDKQMEGVKTMQRSMSGGSPCIRSTEGDESPLRLDRFKIRTVVVQGADQGGDQGGGQVETK